MPRGLYRPLSGTACLQNMRKYRAHCLEKRLNILYPKLGLKGAGLDEKVKLN